MPFHIQKKKRLYLSLILTGVLIASSITTGVLVSWPSLQTSVTSLTSSLADPDDPYIPIQGIWKYEAIFQVNDSSKELVPLERDYLKAYIEFKGNQMCSGEFDSSGSPQTCQYYEFFTINGEVLAIEGGSSFKWSVQGEKLELIQEGISKSLLVKYAPSTKPEQHNKKITFSFKRTPLEGLWKVEKHLYDFDEATGEFMSEDSSADFVEFKGNRFCSYILFNGKGLPTCNAVYYQMKLKDKNIILTPNADLDFPQKGTWKKTKKNLELLLTHYAGSEPEGKSKMVLTKWPTISKSKLKQLSGVWKSSQYFYAEWPSTEFIEGTGTESEQYLGIVGYQICPWGSMNESGFECQSWQTYTLAKGKIILSEENPEGEFSITFQDGQLEFISSMKGSQSKNIFTKTDLKPPALAEQSG